MNFKKDQEIYKEWILSNSNHIIILWELLIESMPYKVKRTDENFFKFIRYLYQNDELLIGN